ncbi:MAG: DUF4241 domain-containing protein, partial [Myxococcales bacterium]|nr:DUF4241 domain-containing protein [Myxococcales bacterium]
MTRAGADDDNDDKVHSDFDLAFEDGARVEGSWDETWTMRVIELGHLRLESGAILIGDPGVGAFDSEPLARRAPPGRYPVLLAVAEMPGDRRVAAAKLVLRDASVRRWEPAFFEGQDPAVKGLPCYGVDSGTGTFASAEAAGRHYALPGAGNPDMLYLHLGLRDIDTLSFYDPADPAGGDGDYDFVTPFTVTRANNPATNADDSTETLAPYRRISGVDIVDARGFGTND